MEAIILAGGKAERLGEAAGGRPKALVELAGRPLAAYQVAQLAAAGVTRVLVSCAAGEEGAFEAALGGIGPEVLAVPEREAAATITVVPLRSPFGVVDLDDDLVTGFREAPRLDQWVSCGIYALAEEALERFPERGDHETSTFPELAREGRLCALRHEGIWLTVNTPKDLRVASEYLAEHPGWPA